MFTDKTARVFRFGAFEVNEATGELRKGGIRIKLHAQPFQVLLMLLERPSEIVDREEMRKRLWGDDTFVDFDHSLSAAVNKLRQALNDSASQPRYIETISGKGYRFLAPVMPASSAPMFSEEQTASRDADSARKLPEENPKTLFGPVLAAPHDLPAASHTLIRTLLLLIQAMYLAFYLGALANLEEIRDIFWSASPIPPVALMTILVTTAVAIIPVRLFIFAAVAFHAAQLPAKFKKLFPVLFLLDLLWALSPFLLIHHISLGVTLGMSAALVYLPFAQRSLVLMYAKGRSGERAIS